MVFHLRRVRSSQTNRRHEVAIILLNKSVKLHVYNEDTNCLNVLANNLPPYRSGGLSRMTNPLRMLTQIPGGVGFGLHRRTVDTKWRKFYQTKVLKIHVYSEDTNCLNVLAKNFPPCRSDGLSRMTNSYRHLCYEMRIIA